MFVAAVVAWPAPRPLVAVPTLAPAALDAPSLLLADWLASPALGVDSSSPRLSWAAPPTVAVQVAATVNMVEAASGTVVWAVRIATSSSAVTYSGTPLAAATTYSWTVTVEAADGHITQPSAPATLITGLHGATASTALWAPSASGLSANQSAMFVFMRYEAALPTAAGPLISAVAFITASPQAYLGPNVSALRSSPTFLSPALNSMSAP